MNKSRKALEAELLYSEEPEAFESGYEDYHMFKDNSKFYSGMTKLAYEAGWNKADNLEQEFNEGY